MWALSCSGLACSSLARTSSASTRPRRTRRSAWGRNTSSGISALSASLMPRCLSSARAPSSRRAISACTLELGRSSSALATRASITACLLRASRRNLTSRSRFFLMSARRPSTEPSAIPSDLARASFTSGRWAASIFLMVTRKSAVLPATSLPWYSAGNARGKVLLSPDFMPRTASSNSLSSSIHGALGEAAALLAQDVDGLVDGGIRHFSRQLFDFGIRQIGNLDFWEHFENGIESDLAFRSAFLFGDAGLASNTQVGFVGCHGKGFTHLVVQHFVLHRVAVTLGHHVHGHLAGTETVHLDSAGQALEARVDFGLDQGDGHAQRNLALE